LAFRQSSTRSAIRPTASTRVLALALASTVVLVLGGFSGGGARAATDAPSDWPQFLGPNRNGSAPALAPAASPATPWPKSGPRTVWQVKVGAGFAGPVVTEGKVILFQRIGGEEVVQCLQSADGKEVWRAAYPTRYRDDFGFDDGPRGTPSIAGGRVFTYGAEGHLGCWTLTNGARVWSVETTAKFRQRKGFFGMACSPLVEGDRVIVNVGGPDGAGVVAFDAATGQVRWKATDDEASYASPVAATVAGRRQILVLTREALVGLGAADGAVGFRFPFRPAMDASVSAATPLVIGDSVFLSASYGVGGVLLQLGTGAPTKRWSAEDALANHYATSVHHDGFLYGFDGRQEQGCDLRCVDAKTGKVQWSESGLGAGTVTLAGDRLLVLTEKGELLRIAASPARYQVLDRAQVLPFGVRAHPALAGGRFYARSKDRLFCLDLQTTTAP
jgi:outer membrane protein assembly factor BamB